jgi:hypothetical protein
VVAIACTLAAGCGRYSFEPTTTGRDALADGDAQPADSLGDDPTPLTRYAYLKPSSPGASYQFGTSLALAADGRTLAIGSPNEGTTGSGSGGVHVFTRTADVWTEQALIKASNPDDSDRFGAAIAISADGNLLAVGASYESSSATGIDGNQADNSAGLSGAAYVFVRQGTAWQQEAYIKASNTDPVDQFGHSIALSGDGTTLAVGAIGEDSSSTGTSGVQTDNSAESSGAVYVFTRTGTTWAQQAYLKQSNTAPSNQFGTCVALSFDGSTLAVGARYESSSARGIDGNQQNSGATSSGAVYVFARADTTWTQQAYVKASNTGFAANFGYALALSADGDSLAVAAPFENSPATGIDGDQLATSAQNSGAVYVFGRLVSTWSQRAYVKASNTEALDEFGVTLATTATGTQLVVGAHQEDSAATGFDGNQADNSAINSGAAYLFERSSGVWLQRHYLKARVVDPGDQFGAQIEISADGKTLAIAAPSDASAGAGVDADPTDNSMVNAGAVHVYW